MTLTTDRLILRNPAETDVEAIFSIHSDPRTNAHNPAGPIQHRGDATELFRAWDAHWRERGYGYWTVSTLDAPEQIIGFGGVMKKTIAAEYDNNLYFRFSPEAWGRGYAGEMVEAALEHTFNVARQTRVLGITRPHNTAARKTMARAGLEQIAVVDDVSGAPSVLYALERKAYLTRTPPEKA